MIKVDGIYHMYFNGQAVGDQTFLYYDIGHAWSTDGKVWNLEPTPVLTRGADGEWDDTSLWGIAVIYDESEFKFKMWYSGGNGSSLDIGYAVSSDGVDWTRHEGNPVVASLPDEGYHLGSVLVDDTGLFEMWYNDVLPDTVRLASSDRHAVFIFVNGFETGDTSAWSAVVP